MHSSDMQQQEGVSLRQKVLTFVVLLTQWHMLIPIIHGMLMMSHLCSNLFSPESVLFNNTTTTGPSHINLYATFTGFLQSLWIPFTAQWTWDSRMAAMNLFSDSAFAIYRQANPGTSRYALIVEDTISIVQYALMTLSSLLMLTFIALFFVVIAHFGTIDKMWFDVIIDINGIILVCATAIRESRLHPVRIVAMANSAKKIAIE